MIYNCISQGRVIKANGIQGIFKVQPVIIIQSLKHSQNEVVKAEEKLIKKEIDFASVLNAVCHRDE